jgi:hypothetical protein
MGAKKKRGAVLVTLGHLPRTAEITTPLNGILQEHAHVQLPSLCAI